MRCATARGPIRATTRTSASSRSPCYELFPKGQEPQTEWDYTPKEAPNWLSVLPQDFSNMAAVQQGMKSAGFRGHAAQPVPRTQHGQPAHQLSKYMGTGEPQRESSAESTA